MFWGLTTAVNTVKAQISATWEPMYLTVSGSNLIDGVEGFFTQSTCNSEPVIFVKFVNHNTYDVKISWFDGFFTSDSKWTIKSNPQDLKNITLNAQKEISGNCSSDPNLVIKIKDALPNASSFKRYNASSLIISVN